MYTCPHCHAPSISFWRKQILGPVSSTTCASCKRKVGVPFGIAMLALAPFVVAIVAANSMLSPIVKVFFWISGFLVTSYLYHRFVPLIQK